MGGHLCWLQNCTKGEQKMQYHFLIDSCLGCNNLYNHMYVLHFNLGHNPTRVLFGIRSPVFSRRMALLLQNARCPVDPERRAKGMNRLRRISTTISGSMTISMPDVLVFLEN